MIKCKTEHALRAELTDLFLDLRELDGLSLNIQFNGKDVSFYRYWLRNTISYTMMAMEILNPNEDDSLNPTDFDTYCDMNDLRDLTSRVNINYKRLVLAYESEVGDEFAQMLNIIGLCLKMTQGYAKI